MIENMQAMMKDAFKMAKENATLSWRLKRFDTVEEIETFLNDGKKITNLQIFRNSEEFCLIYAVVE